MRRQGEGTDRNERNKAGGVNGWFRIEERGQGGLGGEKEEEDESVSRFDSAEATHAPVCGLLPSLLGDGKAVVVSLVSS